MALDSRSFQRAVALVLVLAFAGCFGEPTPDTTPASKTTVGGGAAKVLIVGVYQDQVSYWVHENTQEQQLHVCGIYDWRVSFTTHFTKENGTYVYDAKDAQEYSVKTNDSALLAHINVTKDEGRPAILSWVTLASTGCEYQNDHVATGLSPVEGGSV